MKANSLPSHLKWIVDSFGFDFLFPVIFQLFIVSRKGAVFLVPVFFYSTFHALGDTPDWSVTITATAEFGQTLSASNTLADTDGLWAITYQWYSEWLAIKSTLKNGVGGVDGLDYAADIMLSADGQHAYVAGYLDDAVSW